MKIPLRSNTVTVGKLMSGARSLLKANGMKPSQIGKPIIAVANSFTQFVPGHVHLHPIGQLVKAEIEKLGCFAAEFNTIAVDDGIAMGHEGMLYSLPSREVIADSVEYMVKAHCADALFCISNCDKITPGMLMASMRLNIPTIFVSGGAMEAGTGRTDLVTAIGAGANTELTAEQLQTIEDSACPTCGSCSGMFTANSMNCLNEALGMALPGNGTILATHTDRTALFVKAAAGLVRMANEYYTEGNTAVLPRSIATLDAFKNAMTLDIAMGGSTNTVLHILAIAHEAGVPFTMKDIDELSRRVPVLCKVAPSSEYHIEDVNRAGGIMGILAELKAAGLINTQANHVENYAWPDRTKNIGDVIQTYNVLEPTGFSPIAHPNRFFYLGAPAGVRSGVMGSQSCRYHSFDIDRAEGCIRDIEHAYSKDGGLAVLYGNLAPEGCIVKTAGVDPSMLVREGRAIVFDSQEAAMRAILDGTVKPGHAVFIILEGPKGGPGMQEMLYPTTYLKRRKLDLTCFLVTDGRFSGGTNGPCIGHVSPEAASGGLIGFVRDGDLVSYDIPNRRITLHVSDEEIAQRRLSPPISNRNRVVSAALRKYAHFVTSASKGAILEVP